MKSLAAILLILVIALLYSCQDEKIPESNPFKPDFYNWQCSTKVSINDAIIVKYLRATKSPNSSRLFIDLNSSDSNFNYYYPINISIPQAKSGTYSLHSIGNFDSIGNINYMKVCCYSNPDVIYESSNVIEGDSTFNYIRVHLSPTNNKLSGMFRATVLKTNFLIPGNNPDTIRIRCDTFNCTYNIK